MWSASRIELRSLFEVVAFTSYDQHMADKVFDVLDPAGTRFNHRLYAGSCKQFGLKDLSVLGRPTGRVIIIDDSYKKCILNPDNWHNKF
ncbi:hypothetical protein GOP47_0010736 [Adiantum capillus-veneris]|uniref:Mitochondrial import inner membrane translocase subunit TIM50 n=1 Tax=Adiantum capillus-veneris TaxID=13818 RepID=A0A9D4UV41_ADICA|nr:hypothetical protein GOP47_0010736 [Adiantum capillus-veneris]